MPKHIVITGTSFWNPGDDFVRDGVIRILRSLFPGEVVNLHFYNFNADYFPKEKFSGISNEVSSEDLDKLAPFVDAVVVAGLSAGHEINDLYQWVIRNDLQDRMYLIGAGYENDYVEKHVDLEPAATIFRNARVITGRTKKTPAFMQNLPYHHINCPAILSVENVKQVTAGKAIERVGFSIQLPHEQGVVNHACAQAMYDLAIELMAELAPQCQIEVVAHHKSEYFYFLDLFKQHNIDLPVVFSSFYQDLHDIYPRYDLVVTTRLHAALFANGFGIPAIIINDTDRHTHCMKGFPHVLQAADKLSFATALERIQQWDLCTVAEEAAAFKQQLLAEYVRTLAPAFGIAPTSIAGAGSQNAVGPARIAQDYKFDSEKREQLLVRRLVRPGMTVLDVGANIGKYTKLFSLLTGDKGRVYTFEPSQYAFGRLAEDVQRYGCGNVTLINKAVCAQCGKVTLNEFPERYCSWNSMGRPQMENPENLAELVPISRSVDVEALTLDAFCEQQKISHIDYLKLDVEGAELDALKGAEGLLRRQAVDWIQFEISKKMLEGMGRRAREVFELLACHGYTCHEITDQGEIGEVVDDSDSFYTNYIAVPSGQQNAQVLPVHFFTIVLNGKPFIQYHIEAFKNLPYRWHWHIVEGVAALKHDTAWSVAQGGRITDALHREGLSNDGTSDYLDRLVAAYPDNITVYRKPRGEFWDGKLEMVNAPLSNIQESCLLWQIDADELWTREQLIQARELFLSHPDRTAAYYWCNYFVGERLVTTTRDTYGNNSGYEWLRTWRFSPGCRWAAHEPPRLCTPNDAGDWVDLASRKMLTHQETELAGLVFQHYAYVTEAQLSFKEDYYGYRNAVEQWRLLQSATLPAALKDYFAWVTGGAHVDTYETIGIEPLAMRDGEGQWCFKHVSLNESMPRHILWVRTDAIGDNVLAGGMLPALRIRFPDAIITVVCQGHITELYRNCPYINEVVGFDIRRFTQDPEYKSQLLKSLNALHPDLVLNSVYSREPQTDELCLSIKAAEHIAFSGDLSNIADSTRQDNNARYTRLIECVGEHKVETERHREFLAGLGVDAPELQPRVWSNTDDVKFAEEIFKRQDLNPSRTIVCAPGSQWNWKVYPHYAEVLASFTNYDLVVVGGTEDVVLGDELCGSFTGRSINLAGQTSLVQTAELMRRCRLVVSSDSASAHIACAVGVTNVVVTGGGHFGRFMPYTPLTAVVCLPLDCFGCNWVCPHESRHCIKDIEPTVVIDAIRHQLASDKLHATLFMAAPSTWHPTGSMPAWKMNTYLTQIIGVDVRIVSSMAGMGAPDPVAAEQSQGSGVSKSNQAEMLTEQGEQCFLDGNMELARACFAHALEVDPSHATSYNNIAVLHWRAGEQAQAMQFLAQGMELEPDNRDLVINGVQMLRDCGEKDKADDLCRSYLADFPRDDEMRAILDGTAPSTVTAKPATMHPQSNMTVLKAAIGSTDVKRRVLANLERLTPDIYLARNLEVFRTAIHKGEDWFDSPTLLNWYASTFKPATYLEIGVRRGRSMAQVLMGSPECRCFGFDMWIPNYSGVDNPGPEFVLREMRKLRARKVPVLIEGNSHDSLPAFWGNPANPQLIDLIYVDGDHTYDGAKLDLDLAFQHLADSGALIFDDIDHSSHSDLYPLWNEYKIRYPEYLFIEDHSGNGTACAFKPPFTYLETYLREVRNNTDTLSDAEIVAELIETGEQLFIIADYDEAREKFELALLKDPGNADVLNNLCVLAWRTGDSEGAMKYLANAITQECPSKQILENGAQILNRMMCGIEQIDAQAASESSNDQDGILATVLQAREANRQGEALFATGAIDKAAQAFLAALVADPNSALAHSNLSTLFWHLGDQREALRYLAAGLQCTGLIKEIMENGAKILSAIADGLDEVAEPAQAPSEISTQQQNVDSSSFADLLAAGESAFNTGDYSAARASFEHALMIDACNAVAHNNLAVLSWQVGDTPQALAHLAQALESGPDCRDAILNGVKILIALGKDGDAVALSDAWLADYPGDEEIQLLAMPLRGNATKSDDSGFQQALNREKLSGIDDEDLSVVAALNEEGEQLFTAGNSGAAREKFIAAYELTPKNGTTCNNLAVLAWQSGDFQTATSYLAQAMDAEPENSAFVINAVKLLIEKGCIADALAVCVSYLREDPAHPELNKLRQDLELELAEGVIAEEIINNREVALFKSEDEESRLNGIKANTPQDKRDGWRDSLLGGNVSLTEIDVTRSEPLVSVIVSTYNSEILLRDCLRDLEQQSIADRLEIIVVDSGSLQNERSIVQGFQRIYTNIIYLRTENRETIYAAWNRGVRAAKGRYVTNANTDDAHHPQALEKLVNALETSPDADLAYADCQWTNSPNQRVGSKSVFRTVKYPEYHPGIAMLFCFLGPHPVWRRSVFERIGFFDPKYNAAGDYEFQMRFIAAGLTAVKVPEVLSTFYQNTEGLTLGSEVSTQEAAEITSHYRSVIPISRLYPMEASNMIAVAQGWVAQGNLAAAFICPWIDHVASEPEYATHCYRTAIAIDPGSAIAWRNLLALLGRHGNWTECERLLSLAPSDIAAALVYSVRNKQPIDIEHVTGFEVEVSPCGRICSNEVSCQDRVNDACQVVDGSKQRRSTAF